MHQTTLLIIDDEACWLRTAAEFFTIADYKVHTAATCAEGIAQAKAFNPDCVLLDFHLTDGTAGDVCSALRDDLVLKKIPIIIISGDLQQELDAYSEHKADSFILKGTRFAKIQVIIESVLRRVSWGRGISERGDLRLEKETLQVFRDSKSAATLSPEQFTLFSLLIDKSPGFLDEQEISKHVLGAPEVKSEAVRALLHRLRQKLGRQLGRRIKGKRNLGWIYVQPRLKPV